MNKFYKPQQQQKRIRTNEYIRVPEVLVIDENGQKVGVLPTQEALKMARERGLDLLEIAPTAKPPVCRIMDYGKYLYQQEKSARQKKIKSKQVEVKGVRLTFRISDHDMEIRAKQTEKFLLEGNKVRVELVLKGREKYLKNFSREKMEKFMKLIQTPHKIDSPPKNLPSSISIILAPDNK